MPAPTAPTAPTAHTATAPPPATFEGLPLPRCRASASPFPSPHLPLATFFQMFLRLQRMPAPPPPLPSPPTAPPSPPRLRAIPCHVAGLQRAHVSRPLATFFQMLLRGSSACPPPPPPPPPPPTDHPSPPRLRAFPCHVSGPQPAHSAPTSPCHVSRSLATFSQMFLRGSSACPPPPPPPPTAPPPTTFEGLPLPRCRAPASPFPSPHLPLPRFGATGYLLSDVFKGLQRMPAPTAPTAHTAHRPPFPATFEGFPCHVSGPQRAHSAPTSPCHVSR